MPKKPTTQQILASKGKANEPKVASIYNESYAGRPKRPACAYNLFFHLERERLISRDSQVAQGPLQVQQYTVEDAARAARLLRDKNPNQSGRKHVKTHGVLGFREMSQTIAAAWKNLDEATRTIFESQASLELTEFRRKFSLWKFQQARRQRQANDDQTAGTNSVPTSNGSDNVRTVSSPLHLQLEPLQHKQHEKNRAEKNVISNMRKSLLDKAHFEPSELNDAIYQKPKQPPLLSNTVPRPLDRKLDISFEATILERADSIFSVASTIFSLYDTTAAKQEESNIVLETTKLCRKSSSSTLSISPLSEGRIEVSERRPCLYGTSVAKNDLLSDDDNSLSKKPRATNVGPLTVTSSQNGSLYSLFSNASTLPTFHTQQVQQQQRLSPSTIQNHDKLTSFERNISKGLKFPIFTKGLSSCFPTTLGPSVTSIGNSCSLENDMMLPPQRTETMSTTNDGDLTTMANQICCCNCDPKHCGHYNISWLSPLTFAFERQESIRFAGFNVSGTPLL